MAVASGPSFYPLDNTVQPYDWGSTTAIQELLGRPVDGRPAAELWLGAHPSAPSHVDVADGTATLIDLIRVDPVAMLGQRVLDDYGPRLPYLFKVLAARRALSLQVHPMPHLARAGFNRENRAGVPIGAPHRSFHDSQHKPELVVALTPFEALSGFRLPVRAIDILDGVAGELASQMRALLAAWPDAKGVRAAFALAVRARSEAGVAADLAVTIADLRQRLANDPRCPRAYSTAVALAEQHPGDPGALVSLLLNRVSLAPGESMYLPAGHVHAYLSGCALEVMSSSDNVLRAGLTTKHVDVDALVECAVFEPGPPVHPKVIDSAVGPALYLPPIAEYALLTGGISTGVPVSLHPHGPRIVLGLEGRLELRSGDERHMLGSGESVFVPDSAGPVTAVGEGRLAAVFVP